MLQKWLFQRERERETMEGYLSGLLPFSRNSLSLSKKNKSFSFTRISHYICSVIVVLARSYTILCPCAFFFFFTCIYVYAGQVERPYNCKRFREKEYIYLIWRGWACKHVRFGTSFFFFRVGRSWSYWSSWRLHAVLFLFARVLYKKGEKEWLNETERMKVRLNILLYYLRPIFMCMDRIEFIFCANKVTQCEIRIS